MAYGVHMTVSLRSDEEARAALPPPGPLIRRAHRHPRLMHHNRLIAAVLAVNLAIAWYGATTGGWWSSPAVELATIAAVAQANFVLAVLPRQPQIVNLAGWLATRPRSTRSLRLRWAVGKYYHLGGVHVGAALAGTAWYLAYVVTSIVELARGVPTVTG